MKNSVRNRKRKSPASRQDILRVLKENREAIRALGVRRLALFGSFARNEATRASDLDFVVEFERKSFDAYMDLKTFLEKLFGYRVDLVLAEAIKPRLRTPILEGAIHAPGL
ncbi:nucleotidyltransferase [bacterium]|nr:MAG: nucleotidyltransferase [bacterium]